jgi:hypothetical protein
MVKPQCTNLRPYGINWVMGTKDTSNRIKKGNELAFTGITLVFLAESCHGVPFTHSEWQGQRLKTL